MQVLSPWKLASQDMNADRWRWAYGYLSNRGIDPNCEYFLKPSTGTPLETQVDKLVKFSQCSRNWVTFLCESPTYMRTLFNYTLVSYVFSTNERALVVDAEDLIESADDVDGELRDLVEYVNLLMICYVDSDHSQFRWKRATVANILQRRKMRKLSTFLEVFVPSLEDPLPSEKRLKYTMSMVDSFGAHAYELFTGSNAKNVVVRHDRRVN